MKDYENQKSELFKNIWKIAEDLRGKVDGWDFKSYVLGFLFFRYIGGIFKWWWKWLF